MNKTIKNVFTIVVLAFTSLISKEIILQQGDSYQGCSDCYVYQFNKGFNPGDEGGSNSDTLVNMRACWAPYEYARVCIKFDSLNKYIPVGTIINKATISLFVKGLYTTSPTNGNGSTIGDSDRGVKRAHKILETWNEETAEWGNPWPGGSWGGGNYDQNNFTECVNNDSLVWEEWDATSMIQEFVNEPSNNFGFIVKYDRDDYGCWYPSSESPDVELRPKLYINYGPTKIASSKNRVYKTGVSIIRSNKNIKVIAPFDHYKMNITNSRGQNITTMKGENNTVYIARNMLQRGVYFLSISDNNRTIIKKLVMAK